MWVGGDTIDVIAVKTGIAYVDCAQSIHNRISAAASERKLLPELGAARFARYRAALMPAALEGDNVAIRTLVTIDESERKLFGVDKKVEENAAVIEIAFAFGSEGRVRVAKALPGSRTHDLRPSPDSVDRDRDEDGQDGSGVGVDLGGDSTR